MSGTVELVDPTAPPNDGRPRWVELMRPAAELAVQVAATEFVPAELRNRPEAIAAAILFGAELGIGPMVALAKIAVVKGRPAPSAELGRALALAAGHDLWIEDATNTRVVMCGKRRASTHTFKVSWSLDDAKRAGIAGNPAYAKYPRQMLVARASAELVRQMCPDVLGGITVFAEEAADLDTDTAPSPAGTDATRRPEPSRKRRRTPTTPKPETAPTDEHGAADSDNTNGDADVDGTASAAQRAHAMAQFNAAGITERTDRLKATSAFIGRQASSWNELSRSEASTVIDALEHLAAGNLTFTIDDNGTWHAEAVADPDLDE
jgi:hypothetical protein